MNRNALPLAPAAAAIAAFLPNATQQSLTAGAAVWADLLHFWTGWAKDAAQLPITTGARTVQPMLQICRTMLDANHAGAQAALVVARHQPALMLAAAQATSSAFCTQASKLLDGSWCAIAAIADSTAPTAQPSAAPQ